MLAKDYFERFCGYAGTLLKSKLIEDIINSIKRELSDVDMQNYHSQVN